MNYKKDLAIVIQGPYHKNSVDAIDYYKSIAGKVIVSAWDDEQWRNFKSDGVTVISNPYLKVPQYAYNSMNVYKQAETSTMGLLNALTEGFKFSIKVRSDQYVGNFMPMIKRLFNSPDKYICSNLHFRPDNLLKFHPSDKIIAAETRSLFNAFHLTLERCSRDAILLQSGIYDYNPKLCEFEYDRWAVGMPLSVTYPGRPIIGANYFHREGCLGLCPEMIIGTSWLMSKGIVPNPGISKQIMSDNFDIVRVEDMLPYINKLGESEVEHNWIEVNSMHDFMNGIQDAY